VILIYYGYKSKQKRNKLLESKVKERTNELHTANEKLLDELSERKLAEEKLQENENFLKEIIQSMSDGFSILDKNGIHIDVNFAFRKMTGFSKEDLIGVGPPHPYWPEEEYENIQKAFVKTSQGDFQSFELVFKKKNGERFPVLVNPSQIKDEKGNVISSFASIVDITKRKQAEQKMADALEMASNAEKAANLGSWSWVLSSNKVEYSDNMCRLHGIEPSEFESTFEQAGSFQHPEDKTYISNQIELMLKQKKSRLFEYRIITPAGELKWVEGTNQLLFDEKGEIREIVGTVQDLTDKKKVEEALKESEEKLNALFSSLTEMVVMHELVLNDSGEAIDYRIIDCNKVFTEFTGIPKEDAVGKLASEVYQADPPPYLEDYAKVGLSGDAHEFTSFHPSLNKHLMISAVSPQIGKFATITTDITPMMQIQEMIVAKNKEMESYLYVASHDLRTPLVNIQGFSQRFEKQADLIKKLMADEKLKPEILHQLANITDENIPKILHFINSNIEKMDILINGLLQLSRTGRVEMTIQKIDMNRMFKKILQRLDYQIKESQCEIHIDSSSGQ